MSFLDESDFDSKNKANRANYDNDNEDDDDLSNQFGNRVNLGTPSGGRARMLAQEREKQLKRRQNAAQSEGMIRSSMSPANSKPAQGQFTPAIRQFSAPKNVTALEDDEEDEEFDKLAKSKSSQLGRSANSRATGYDDGEDDLDDNDYRRSKRREENAKLKIVNKNYEDSDEENINKKGTSKQDRIAEQLAQHHSKVVKVSEAHKTYNNSINKGSYRDDEEEEDENDNRNSHGRPSKQSTTTTAPRQSYQRNHYQDDDEEDDDDDDDDDNRTGKDNWAKTKSKSNRNVGNGRESTASSRSGSRHRRHQDDDDDEEEDEDDDGDHVVDDDEDDGEGGSRSRKPNVQAEPLDLSDMKRFLLSPIPRGCGIVQCYIKRNKVGVNKLFPVYSLYLKEPNRFLMASKKRPNNKTSNYLISMNEADLSRDGANYLGKLRSNFVGTEFQIFDDGVNPNDGDKSHPHHADVRKELGAVIYAANVLGSRGPRKMQVAIPGVDENNEVIPFIPSGRPSTYSPPKRKSSFSLFGGGGGAEDTLSNGDDLLARIKDRNFRNLAYFINKPPRWNDQVGAYVLNFNGRVTMASVKNFQLVDPDEINDVNLQFGRVGKDDFTMDLQWPMSPFQAFAITLSSFDSKIACD